MLLCNSDDITFNQIVSYCTIFSAWLDITSLALSIQTAFIYGSMAKIIPSEAKSLSVRNEVKCLVNVRKQYFSDQMCTLVSPMLIP